MKKIMMPKSTAKVVFALCVALSIFVCRPMATFAAVSSDNISPRAQHTHDFRECCQESEGYSRVGGTHTYLYGYDHNGNEIMKTCDYIYHYKYCHYVCKICKMRESNERHDHWVSTTHSVSHPDYS